jgi:hypothetical protein
MATNEHFWFVDSSLSLKLNHRKSNRRKYELQLSDIRSHAGRIAYARRERNPEVERGQRQRSKPRGGRTQAIERVLNLGAEDLRTETGPTQDATNPEQGKPLEVNPGRTDNEVLHIYKQRSSQYWNESVSWQWSKGARVDPFNCIPWKAPRYVQVTLDFRGFLLLMVFYKLTPIQ